MADVTCEQKASQRGIGKGDSRIAVAEALHVVHRDPCRQEAAGKHLEQKRKRPSNQDRSSLTHEGSMLPA